MVRKSANFWSLLTNLDGARPEGNTFIIQKFSCMIWIEDPQVMNNYVCRIWHGQSRRSANGTKPTWLLVVSCSLAIRVLSCNNCLHTYEIVGVSVNHILLMFNYKGNMLARSGSEGGDSVRGAEWCGRDCGGAWPLAYTCTQVVDKWLQV